MLLFGLLPFIFPLLSFIFKPKTPTQKINKLTDRNVEASGYGTSRMLVAGRVRASCTRVYTEPLRETKKTKKKKGQKSETYYYYFTGTHEVAKGLIRDSQGRIEPYYVEKIFCDGKLYWQESDGGAVLEFAAEDGRLKRIVCNKYRWRFYPGTDNQPVEAFVKAQMNNSNITHYDTMLFHFDDLPILEWGQAPSVELVIRPYRMSESVAVSDYLTSNHTIIKALYNLAGIDSNYYQPLDSPTPIEGVKIIMGEANLQNVIQDILNLTQLTGCDRNGSFVTQKANQFLNEDPTILQASKHCAPDNLVSTQTTNKVYKTNGFEITFADNTRSLEATTYSHALASDDTAQNNQESLDYSNFTMNTDTAYRVVEYATSRNYYNFNSNTFTLVPLYYNYLLPNELLLLKDDLTNKDDLYTVIEKTVINADMTQTVTCTDTPLQTALIAEEFNDYGTTDAAVSPESNSLLALPISLLRSDDFTSFAGIKGQYIIPEINSGGMDVYTSLDQTNYRYAGQVGDKKVTLTSLTTIASATSTGWFPNDSIDFTVDDDKYIPTMVSQYNANEAQNNTSLAIYAISTGEVLSFASCTQLGTNSIRLSGVKRGYRNASGASYSIGSQFIILKANDVSFADVIEVDSNALAGQTIYYQLAKIGSLQRTNTKQFTFTNNI
jgi:hypothetical protein